jgi:tetratricopeptide (TPR) repeat protein
MRTGRRVTTVATSLALVLAAGLALVLIGGVVGRHSDAPAADTASIPSTVDMLDQSIARSQDRLRRLPGDYQAWSGLSKQYLERARISGDPTYYPKADEAVQRSLTVKPDNNTDALVALGALENARHDFATAREHALAAIAINAYHSEAYAVLADAETQLGHPAAASDAVQHLLDLRPGLSAYARASYDLELRGMNAEATDLMRRALGTAVDRHDIAFCRNQLGDLALNAGDLSTARAEYSAGLAQDPTSITLQRGQARLAAMSGELESALRGYAHLTRRAPTPGYLIEYAEVLRAAGRDADAQMQLRLASAAHQLFVGNGGTDGLTGAALAMATGRPDEALREAQAEWNRRQFVDVADTLGWALHVSNRDAEALTYARRAYDSGARSASYAYHLGMIELAVGDRSAAREHLSRALEINPTFSPVDAPSARAALDSLER